MSKTYIPVDNKDDERFDLLKVPDSVLLKDALQEIGTLKAYIEELEDKIGNQDKYMKQEYKDRIQEKCNTIEALRMEIARLQQDILGEDKKEFVKKLKSEDRYQQMQNQIDNLKKKNKELESLNSKLYTILGACHTCKVIMIDEKLNIVSREKKE